MTTPADQPSQPDISHARMGTGCTHHGDDPNGQAGSTPAGRIETDQAGQPIGSDQEQIISEIVEGMDEVAGDEAFWRERLRAILNRVPKFNSCCEGKYGLHTKECVETTAQTSMAAYQPSPEWLLKMAELEDEHQSISVGGLACELGMMADQPSQPAAKDGPIAQVQSSSYPHIVLLRPLTQADVGVKLIPESQLASLQQQLVKAKQELAKMKSHEYIKGLLEMLTAAQRQLAERLRNIDALVNERTIRDEYVADVEKQLVVAQQEIERLNQSRRNTLEALDPVVINVWQREMINHVREALNDPPIPEAKESGK